MRILLDTHSFIWLIKESDRLSYRALQLLEDSSNNLFLSVGSLWEMAIKESIGKLEVPLPFTRLEKEYVTGNDIQKLLIRSAHLDQQRILSSHHKDPFDRLIIAQAIVEGMKVVSIDQKFDQYPVERLWS